jgi:hypothetical protein
MSALVQEPPPSKEQVEQAIAVREKEIEWNIRRLANLVLSDEDRQQTEDLIFDLRDECELLKRRINVT